MIEQREKKYVNVIRMKISRKIKSIPFIRLIMKPFKVINDKLLYFRYHNSKEPQRLGTFHDKFSGKSCFIIGNGPSLCVSDLDRLTDKYTFACNSVYDLFGQTKWRPTFYTCQDIEAIKLLNTFLADVDSTYKFFRYEGIRYFRGKGVPNNMFFFFSDVPFTLRRYDSCKPYISEDVTKKISDCRTVTFINIQLAIYMGFTKIYLLGMDHCYGKIIHKDGTIEETKEKTYADGIRDLGFGVQFIDNTTEGYEVAKKYCDENGITIRNVTRGGKLEVFARENLDSVLLDT